MILADLFRREPNKERIESLLALSQTAWESRDALVDHALEEAVRLTGSKMGYLHFLRAETFNATDLVR